MDKIIMKQLIMLHLEILCLESIITESSNLPDERKEKIIENINSKTSSMMKLLIDTYKNEGVDLSEYGFEV